MNGIVNEHQLAIVKKYDYIKQLFQKMDSIFDHCYRDCHDKYFHTFKYRCIYYFKFTNFGNNEVIDLTIFDKIMFLYEFKKKLKIARQRGFIFNQRHKLTKKFIHINDIFI